MTGPHPGLKVSPEERLAAMHEALNRTEQEHDEPVVDLAPDDEVVVEPVEFEPEVVHTFDAEALADLAADTVRRQVRPEDRPGDLLVQALSGGAVGEEAIYQLGRRNRRAGWHYSIDPRTGARTPHQR